MTTTTPLPHNTEAESAVLGAILLDNSLLEQALDTLTADEFYDPKHRTIWTVMQSLVASHAPVELLTLTKALKQRSLLDGMGGTAGRSLRLQRK